MDGVIKRLFKFHDGSTTISNGNIMNVYQRESLLQVEINTAGTVTIIFEAAGDLDVWKPLIGSKMVADLSIVSETSDISSFYQFDISGYLKIRMRVSATSGDALYVYGKVIGS